MISEKREGAEERVRSLSALIHNLADSSPAESLPFDLFQRVFRSKADENGWVTSGGSIRAELVAKSYLSYFTSLWKAPELGELPVDLETATVQVSRLFRAIRSGTHPIRRR